MNRDDLAAPSPAAEASPQPLPFTPLPQGRKPRRGDRFVLGIDGLDEEGEAVGRWGPFRVRLRRAAPGDRLEAEVLRRRGDRIEARSLRLLSPSPRRTEPPCPHFGTCGGCRLQHLSYPAQLEAKRDRVARALVALDAPAPSPTLGMEVPWHYRNKVDLTFSRRRWLRPEEPKEAPRDFALGFHVPGRLRKVIDVPGCRIAFEEADAIARSARTLALEAGLSAWDPERHEGLLRHLVLRKGFRTGQILMRLIVSEDSPEVRRYAEALLASHPQLHTLTLGIGTHRAVVARADREEVLHGPGILHEVLAGIDFEIAPDAFFQTNTLQAERLVETVMRLGDVEAGQRVWDLCCGVGTLALPMAAAGASVWGIEIVPSAVEAARRNARRSGLAAHARFDVGDVTEVLRGRTPLAPPSERPDLVVLDPPRAGLHPRAVEAVAALAPERLLYVACRPESAARDLSALLARTPYRIEAVQPIDLFPHTPHVEVVVALRRLA